MTAEMVIMNKSAVAISADSAVTVSSQQGKKIFTSANKIFPLSGNSSIAIMIYGSSELMGVPWETIIAMFRNSIQDKSITKVSEVVDHILKFLVKNENKLFPEETQKNVC